MPTHLKRKRATGRPQPPATTATTASAVPFRTTRETSTPPPPVRRSRHRAEANGEPTESSQLSRSPRGKENIPVHPEYQHQRMQHAKPTTRITRHSANQEAPAAPRHSHTNIHHASLAQTDSMTERDTQRPTAPPRAAPSTTPGRQGRRPSTIDPFLPHQQSVSVGRNKPIIMTTSNPMSKLNGTPVGAARGTDSAGQPDRNIDKVVLGDICFRAWYPSYYGKEVLGDISGHSAKGGKAAKSNGSGTAPHNHHEADDDTSGGKTHGRRDRDNHPPMLDRLYVCPCCFKYSKELVTWWEHVRWCERRGVMPGRKIYTHPKGKRTVLVPSGPVPKQGRGKRGSVGQKMVEEVVQDEGEWTIWEVDGEDDVLFCQNLSLFAKLFLDNKSVFFDVTGFNYFLLVYTPATLTTDPSADVSEMTQPRSQIVGFFSKEKMSWDNNNLACILIFPPWQRKGLGALLMGISYEISRREGLLGGPEKPISDLGKRGYKRFWAGEIARWLLSLAPSSKPEEEQKEGQEQQQHETVVDLNHCSQATWIAPEDCLLVLREMGLAEEAGTGPRAAAAATALRVQEPPTKAEEENAQTNAAITTEPAGAAVAAAATTTMVTTAAVDQVVVPRVRISQTAVRAWVAANKISLERACDPDGFIEGYAVKASKAASEEPV